MSTVDCVKPTEKLLGMTGPPNFAVGPVTLTAILYPQPIVDIRDSRRLPKKLGYHEIETNISRAYENLAIFSRRKLVIFLSYYIKNMEVSDVSEPCDVIRVPINSEAMKLRLIFRVLLKL